MYIEPLPCRVGPDEGSAVACDSILPIFEVTVAEVALEAKSAANPNTSESLSQKIAFPWLALVPSEPPNTIPESPPVLPELTRINLSSTFKLDTCASKVFPVTVKSPFTVKLVNDGESLVPRAFTLTAAPFRVICP